LEELAGTTPARGLYDRRWFEVQKAADRPSNLAHYVKEARLFNCCAPSNFPPPGWKSPCVTSTPYPGSSADNACISPFQLAAFFDITQAWPEEESGGRQPDAISARQLGIALG
jgi:hypothetical protein